MSPSRPDSSRSSADSVSAMRFPLEEAVSDVSEAVHELKQRPGAELRRARRHHRRALKSLRNGAYDALSESTREQLIKRFRLNLKALNEALDKTVESE